MPKLLDTRLIGQDIADVGTRDYAAANAGQLLQVGPDGQSMVLGAGTDYNYLSLDAESERSGISQQQFLCRVWYDITPTGSNAFGAIYGMVYAAGIFYIVGADGTGPTANAKIVSSRVDSVTGSLNVETEFNVMTTTPFTGPVYGVTYGDGKLLACGANGKIAVLGTTGWEACNMPDGSEAYYIYRIAYGHRKGWVAVGTATSNSASAGITLYSKDGVTWRIGTPALGAAPVYGVAYGGAIGEEMFVAVGGGVGVATNHIAYSYDGINWELSTTHSSRLLRAHYSVCFGNGRWLVGTQGPQPTDVGPVVVSNLISSTKGNLEWQSVPISNAISTSANSNLQTISYGNGMFIAAGAPIYGSTSGVESAILYQPPVAWVGSAGASCYGNGVFLVGSRGGKLVRSGVINEIGIGTQTVVTQNTSANNIITNSSQTWVFIQDTERLDARSIINLNVPVNTTNTVERMLVNVRPRPVPDGGPTSSEVFFYTAGGFLGGTGALVGSFVLPSLYGPCLLEFYRFPNTAEWYYEIIYVNNGPGSGGEAPPPESCSGTCVMPGSMVSMADGGLRAVETLLPGDWVWDQYNQPVEVVSLIPVRLGNRSIYRINNELGITSDHPIMTAQGWAAVDTAAILSLNDQFFDYGSHQYTAAYACVKAQQVGQLDEQSVVFLENSLTTQLQISQPENHDANTLVYAVALKNADSLIINGVVNGAYNAERII